MLKMLCFALALVIVSGCEDYREIEFPTATVLTTPDMRPWSIDSKPNIPMPLYVFCNGKCLKLDTTTTVDETKDFLKSIGLAYKEFADDTTIYRSDFQREYNNRELHFITAGIFDTLEYGNGKLKKYSLRSKVLSKMIFNVYIGTSCSKAIFRAPLSYEVILDFDDVKKLFGNEYKVRRRYNI